VQKHPRLSQYSSVFLACVLMSAAVFAQTPFQNTLMPQPAVLGSRTGDLIITSQLRVSLNDSHDALLLNATQRMISRLQQQTSLQLDQALIDTRTATIQIEVADHTVQYPSNGIDEGYTLDIRDGSATLHARTDFGAMHGMETILQLVQSEGSAYILPAIYITDSPRFPWRGLLLDPGRHFLPVANILRTLDAMAAVKMNVLHLHLTENQGFRIESKRFPKLQELGSDGQYYTQEDVRQIVRYATGRGIRVVPEFDMPGHTTTWLIGYPELASKPGPYHVEHTNGIKDAAMDPTQESTYHFLDSFIEEMTSLFPDGYMHIGGDETNGKDWRSNPAIVQFMQQHNMQSTSDLQGYFNSRVEKLLTKHHRRMVGWDEILRPDLSPDVVVQNWHGIEFLIDGARQGHQGFLSKPFYLDHHYSAEEMYTADPIPAGDKLTPAQEKLILGGEACMWGEQVDFNTVDSRIWPRAAAVAERLWSPQSVRNPEDMYRRLAVMSLRLDGIGIEHISYPERGLRQLTLGDPSALKVFASVVQPVDFHERYREQQTSPLTPMANVVDFTVSDPLSRERFAERVRAYLQSVHEPNGVEHSTDRALLDEMFHSWLAAASHLSTQSLTNPRLSLITERRNQWMQLALLGLQAMALIESHQCPQDSWVASQQELIKSSAQPQELVDFVILGPLDDLLRAASQTTSKP